MTAEQAQAWREIALTSSYQPFADEVEGGAALIEQALAVQ
jgi:hypothetical protein